jgi:hypothetical protein
MKPNEFKMIQRMTRPPGYLKMLLSTSAHINPLTPELNPSAQRCLMRFFKWGFAS